MNKLEAQKIVAVIIASCPTQGMKLDRERTAMMVDAFTSLLDDVTYEQANAAIRVLLQTRTWMPSVADIRATVLELARGPVRSGGEAWGSVLKAIKCEGAYRTPGTDFNFVDPVTARCVASLGWTELCLSENATADRARFIDAYDRMATQHQREGVSPLLAAANDSKRIAPSDSVDVVKQLAEGMRFGGVKESA